MFLVYIFSELLSYCIIELLGLVLWCKNKKKSPFQQGDFYNKT